MKFWNVEVQYRGVGRGLREDDSGRRGRGGIAVVQFQIQIAKVVGWHATDHTTL